ncbi:hypothetical protein Dsin_021728 [Dipteronia sinensis]|uniref:Voltage-gated hydrogen channel 1 n=1 Tax=Dipteronia sinensis TaxID=43782 RepID=A0AAE0A039_9ROSI|nr:hypothetical protein Dsin_021728 [Dipteronia sinensis]
MNPPISIESSIINSISNVESVELSIQNLIKINSRRSKWKLFFNPIKDQNLNTVASWRKQLASFVESTPVGVISILLLVLDLIITVFELSSSLTFSCTPNKKHDHPENVWYHWVGIAILTLLSGKTVALVVGLGGAFFRRPGYVVDGAVVIGALILEGFIERKGGGLLVVVCLWRVVRAVESAFELSDEAIEAHIQGLIWQLEALREDNVKLRGIIAEKDEIIEKLQQDLDRCKHHCPDSLQLTPDGLQSGHIGPGVQGHKANLIELESGKDPFIHSSETNHGVYGPQPITTDLKIGRQKIPEERPSPETSILDKWKRVRQVVCKEGPKIVLGERLRKRKGDSSIIGECKRLREETETPGRGSTESSKQNADYSDRSPLLSVGISPDTYSDGKSIEEGKQILVHSDKRGINKNDEGLDSQKGVDATVDRLMSPSGGWNTQLIQNNFLPDDMKSILNIPISPGNQGDKLLWHFETSGNYSVRSGYWVGRDIEIKHGPSSSGDLNQCKKFLDDYHVSMGNQGKKNGKVRGRSDVQTGWCPPEDDLFKTNYGVTLGNNNSRVGLGIIIRNSVGEVNRADISLAENALFIAEDNFWMEDYPVCIANIVENDKPG